MSKERRDKKGYWDNEVESLVFEPLFTYFVIKE
jgi:stalled ribosome alternative rescue factor ArfA